jgi:hypothetical protein
MDGNQNSWLQRCGQLLQVANGRVSAGVGVDEVDRRVPAAGGDSVTAEVVAVGSVKIKLVTRKISDQTERSPTSRDTTMVTSLLSTISTRSRPSCRGS